MRFLNIFTELFLICDVFRILFAYTALRPIRCPPVYSYPFCAENDFIPYAYFNSKSRSDTKMLSSGECVQGIWSFIEVSLFTVADASVWLGFVK